MGSRKVLITGASSGFGRALALEYASRGCHVALCARRVDVLSAVAECVQVLGGKAICVPLDVTDTSAVARAVTTVARDLGGLDVVIANAGRGGVQDATTMTLDDVDSVVGVNVRGAFATLVAAIPVMCSQGSGQLVGVSSLAGARGMPGSAAYCASKAALSTFLESLRVDLAPRGIGVTDVQPGFMDTPMLEYATHRTPWRWSAERAARYAVCALEQSPATIAFPWPLVVATQFARLLPSFFYDRVMRAAGPSAASIRCPDAHSVTSNDRSNS